MLQLPPVWPWIEETTRIPFSPIFIAPWGTIALFLASFTSFGTTAKSRFDFNSLTFSHFTVTSPARSLLNLISVPVEFSSCPVSLSSFFRVSSSLISGSFFAAGFSVFLADSAQARKGRLRTRATESPRGFAVSGPMGESGLQRRRGRNGMELLETFAIIVNGRRARN